MRCDDGAIGASTIVQKPFHLLDGGGEGERADGGGVAVEGHHVVAPGWPVLKHEDLAPALGTKIEKLVSCAAQETGELKVAGFEPALRIVAMS